MGNINPKPPDGERLADCWDAIANARHEMASELDQMAADLPGDGSRRLRSLSGWFRESATLENALHRPDVLAVCVPLMGNDTHHPFSKSDISRAARTGFCSIGRYVSVTRHVLRLLLYPILILFVVGLLGIACCFWVAKPFEDMYFEFGIGLPLLTEWVLGVASFVRQFWWAVLGLFVGLLVGTLLLFWLIQHHGRELRPANMSWIDQQLMSTRNALAGWAWHLSLLLEAGYSQHEGGMIAANATGKRWFRKARFLDREKLAAIDQRGDETPTTHHSLFQSKFEMLNGAVRLSPSDGKIAMLRQVANYYWDRNRSVGDWWIHWLISFMLWGLAGIIIVCVVALLMPMLFVVQGLYGLRW